MVRLFLLVFRTMNTQTATKMIVNKKEDIGCYFSFLIVFITISCTNGEWVAVNIRILILVELMTEVRYCAL